MKEIIFNEAKPKRLDLYISEKYPLIRPNAVNKYIRQNKIKVNGTKASAGQKLVKGDTLSVYLADEMFMQPDKDNAFMFSGMIS